MNDHDRMNYWRRRAKDAEAERDEWKQAAIRLADASDHWAWEYRYADEVREYLADWRKKYTQG